jgi:hypothetical protein
MSDLILNSDQAELLAQATETVFVRNPESELLGQITPQMSPEDAKVVEECRRRLASDQRRYSTEEVLVRLNSMSNE